MTLFPSPLRRAAHCHQPVYPAWAASQPRASQPQCITFSSSCPGRFTPLPLDSYNLSQGSLAQTSPCRSGDADGYVGIRDFRVPAGRPLPFLSQEVLHRMGEQDWLCKLAQDQDAALKGFHELQSPAFGIQLASLQQIDTNPASTPVSRS